MKSFVASTLLALLSAVTVSAQTAFAYPPSVTDTTTHENPFFLQVWSSQNTAYAYHAIGIQPRDNGDWRVVLGQDSVVTGFQLVNGSFQLASPEGQVGAADGFTAVFGPATTDALGFVSKDFYFAAPGSRNQTNANWELLNLSNDGLYSILSNDGGPSTYNGFKVCEEASGSGYYVKYEGSVDGAVSTGCEGIALRTFFGPPF